MTGQPEVEILSVTLRLDDYLWFASFEWGREIETAPLLHGYALSFALASVERVVALGGTPNYDKDLLNLDLYCTPATLSTRSASARQRGVFTYNSVDNPTQLTQALRIGDKANDPKFGRRHVLLPGLRFDLVVFLRNGAVLPRVFRLGKKRSPVVVERAELLTGRAFHGDAVPDHAVNPRDVEGHVRSCIPRPMPPHMIYERASIADDEFVRTERMIVHVPQRVRAWKSA